MLSCRELVEETTSALSLEELQRKQRWAVRLHLLVCRHCRRYVRQLRALLALLPHFHKTADEQTVNRIWNDVVKQDQHTLGPE